MKVVFNENTNEHLTHGKEYLAFEIYMNFDRQTTTFRIINDKGIPSIFNSSDFNYNFLNLENMVYLEKNNSFVITLEKLYLKLNSSEDINNIWERYFNNEENTVKEVNEIIVEYSKKNNIETLKPNPYGL